MFSKEFEFKGKYAIHCRALKDEIKLFKTFREAYATSALVGFLNSRRECNYEDKAQPASIMASELAQKKTDLTFIYRLIMLLDNAENMKISDIQDRTFRHDNDENSKEKLTKNMELFNEYANGGIEILYGWFQDCHEVKDTVNKLNEKIEEFIEDNHMDN